MIRTPVVIFLLLFSYATLTPAQETVTIPKARLEELERKEAELDKLKGAAAPSQAPVPNPKPDGEHSAPKITASEPSPSQTIISAPPKNETISVTSLPPLEKDAVVAAADLAAHYRTDAAAADGRYRKHTFKVQGEIVAFEKPALIRNYDILLKTAEPQTRIICDFYPAEKFKAVYTIKSGTALVGTLPDTRVPIAKVGDHVIIEGRCKGMSSGGVKLTDCELKEVK